MHAVKAEEQPLSRLRSERLRAKLAKRLGLGRHASFAVLLREVERLVATAGPVAPHSPQASAAAEVKRQLLQLVEAAGQPVELPAPLEAIRSDKAARQATAAGPTKDRA